MTIFVYTLRKCTFYQLTPFNLKKIHCKAVLINYGDLDSLITVLNKLPKQITPKKYFSLPQDCIVVLAPWIRYRKQSMTGCSKQNKVKIQAQKGFTQVSKQDYNEVKKLIKPDITINLTQVPSLMKNVKQNSNKSIKRAISKNNYFNDISNFYNVHCSHNEQHNKNLIQSVKKMNNIGFVIHNFISLKQQERKQLINNISTLKMFAGQGKPAQIIQASSYGFQYYQIEYPFSLAQKGIALIKTGDNQYIQHKPLKELPQGKQPLCKDCNCTCCKGYSQGYICHLLQCKQLNANILLTIHNMHLYSQLEQQIK